MIDYEQAISQWRDFACMLWEFIEYDIALNPRQEARFKEILKEYTDYQEGDEN
jgi:hypothetical protein